MVERFFDKQARCLTISVKGRFDYNCHKIFKDAFSAFDATICYVIDFVEVTYLDSSALGMLLLLRDHAGGERADIRLINVNGAVMDTLKAANFHRLFSITE
ncbi:STAS domain-containing protein [Marinomonas sp. M1K-6]|uniref:STAS domain-containing protein n=1 Tax=Marinomonas profundi TaxID=2726122 RepID=A0A847QWL3_9GAMM|nr:STAS domain-containing protein [Marinomonas profundi]NLQ16539.1 STAS domain-containing protein [Marinomonas profundi]UDV03872.1 STAS domain-containing protein [Marinomonas profundi]